ncbi:MAG TPA: response regulator transcription factor [Solirubrobacteraceae bacterium]|nr:response regulator transcription factor [Solirubrobacteraceae bacterium]
MEAFRVIVADDDPLARRMIRSSLQDAGFVVVAEARNGREAVELTQYYSPDAVLMDVVMPELDGISATRQILAERPDQLVILLTGADEEIGLAGLQAGASGYLNKDVDIEALPRALKGAAAGEAAISRTMGTLLIQQLRRAPARPTTNGLRPVRSSLTAREWEVLDLLCDGHSTDQMANELFLSTETVRSHVKSIYRKLGVNSREQAVSEAERLRSAS